MNLSLAKEVISQLVRLGVSSFCICPGGRSAPFVELLSHSKGLSLFYFFEERSAGFFALGRAERDKKPSAVLTTSGTAVAELLPSVIEAFYSAVPLVLISSDRPERQSGKGSPQTLKNTLALLKDYCAVSQNVSRLEDLNLKKWNGQGSLHLNVCFDEPLIDSSLNDERIRSLDFTHSVSQIPSSPQNKLSPSFSLSRESVKSASLKKVSFLNPAFQKKSSLDSFFKIAKKPLLLAGELKDFELSLVKNILQDYRNPIYLEALSNLQGADFTKENSQKTSSRQNKPQTMGLISGEKILSHALKNHEIDSVIRIGAVPRVRFWRDLEKSSVPVLSLSTAPYHDGLGRDSFNEPLFEQAENLKRRLLNVRKFGEDLKAWDESQSKKLEKLFKKYPKSEPAWFLTIKKSLKPHSKIFLGNSSPIRFWDQSLFYQKDKIEIKGQNGVNGIDGLLSRFLGQCEVGKQNIACLGDLSLLYDIPGFWRSKEHPEWRVIVINNFGGRVFSRLYSNQAFINAHHLSFEPLTKMWRLPYKLLSDSALFEWGSAYTLIEVQPSLEETEKFYKAYSSLWL